MKGKIMSNYIKIGSWDPRRITRNEFLSPFDSLFNDILNQSFPSLKGDLGEDFFSKNSYPKVNILSFEDRVEIEAAVPGLTESDIDVEISEGVLSIKGNSNQREDVSDANYTRREVKRSAFCRSFTVGESLDEENISGKYANGILTISIPRITKEDSIPKVKTIQIESS